MCIRDSRIYEQFEKSLSTKENADFLKDGGISCITNLAAGMSTEKLDHKEVQETADRVAKQFKELITGIVTNI